ncbi:MAG: dTDP-4-dehydrorhamnose 3,5-epimerase [Alistipes sp.]|nr:dTDP-4-dehydrorhamnose 3,5-epimerase [Alistipes sp.]
MRFLETALEGVLVLEPRVFRDERGCFLETFSEREFFKALDAHLPRSINRPCGSHHFVQDNESVSRRGVVRGLHFQREPHAQAKLVRVSRGAILDVAVDMRRGSASFGRWVAVKLSAENRRQLFVPRGFAHGFLALEDETVVAYKVDDYYAPECDAGVLWCDPALGIDWGIEVGAAVVSAKDAGLPGLEDAYAFSI